MEKGFYNTSVGYWQTTDEPSEVILKGYPEGTKEVPLKPGKGYEYNGSSWVAPSDEWLAQDKANEVRSKRDMFLATKVDPVVSNPLRWSDLTVEKQQEMSDYRKALLSIPEQAGFPFNVVWPKEPV